MFAMLRKIIIFILGFMSLNSCAKKFEIAEDLKKKKMILEWLMKNKIRDLNDFGKIMNYYYSNRELLLEAIRKNDIKKLLGN